MAGPPPLLDGHAYRIRNKMSNTYLDLDDGKPRGKIQGWEKTHDDNTMFNQAWKLKFVGSFSSGNSYWRLINLRSGTSMDINDGDAHGQVQGWEEAYNGNQDWRFEAEGDAWRLTNRISGTCLDLDDGKAGNRVMVHGWERSDTDGQRWYFERISFTSEDVSRVVTEVAPASAQMPFYPPGTIFIPPPLESIRQIYNDVLSRFGQDPEKDFDWDAFISAVKAEIRRQFSLEQFVAFVGIVYFAAVAAVVIHFRERPNNPAAGQAPAQLVALEFAQINEDLQLIEIDRLGNPHAAPAAKRSDNSSSSLFDIPVRLVFW